jgi:hypothetical protein
MVFTFLSVGYEDHLQCLAGTGEFDSVVDPKGLWIYGHYGATSVQVQKAFELVIDDKFPAEQVLGTPPKKTVVPPGRVITTACCWPRVVGFAEMALSAPNPYHQLQRC